MSATLSATTSATSQAIAEWVKLFPKQVTETYTSSVTFMKQLTVIAVSTITYMKSVFPEESYTVEHFGGVKLKILKKKCRDKLAQFVSTGLMQSFEAFDKKYLHQLVLCFYDGECHVDNLIEYHVFEFTYNSDGVTMNLHSKNRDSAKHSTRYTFDDVKKRTMHLIRVCLVMMQTCHELPSSYEISLRLYYNENAPEGYQAPGFLSASEPEDHLAPTYGESLKLGWVETPFHRLVAHSYFRDNMESSHEANASQNVPIMTQNEGDELCSEVVSEPTSEGGAAERVWCPCNKYSVGDELVMLTCDYCNTLQHAACFGVSRDAAARLARHCCTHCSDTDPARTPTDTRLAKLPLKNRESLCIFRRTLQWCAGRGAVGAAALAAHLQLSRANGDKLMKLLHSHGIIHLGDDSDLVSPRKINHEQLNKVVGVFFQSEECTMVDRLLAETLSQGSQQDPVGDVLGPMEKVSLQNATAMGKIVEHTPSDNVIEDSTLKKYRAAILPSDHEMDEELPLSGSHNPVKDMEKIGKKTTKRKMDETENRQLRSGVKTKRVLPK